MIITLMCLVAALILVVVSQYLRIQKLKKRCKFLNQSRSEWVEKSLESDRELKLTQSICNVTFGTVLRYKSELAAIKDRMLRSENEKGAVS